MTVKRRIVWFSDEDWERIKRQAARAGTSASALLRALAATSVIEPGVGTSRPAPKPGK
jgi:hypothetical protein